MRVPGFPADLVVKSTLSPSSGSVVALRRLNSIHTKGPESFFLLTKNKSNEPEKKKKSGTG